MNISDRPIFSFLPFHPWVYFSIFLVSNFLLSYFPIPLWLHWTALLAGLLLPFLTACLSPRPVEKPGLPLLKVEFLPPIPIAVWILIGVLAAYARFHQLTSLALWPRFDEGIMDYYGLRVMKGGLDRFFFSSSQIPPLYVAWLALNFKLWGSYFTNSLFWPAFFSLLTVPMAYFAARQYFSRSLSLICTLLVALSFWPWYIGRFSSHLCLVPLAEAWALGWMGKWLQSRTTGNSFRTAASLGVGLGLVCYAVYLHWISVLIVLLLTVLWTGLRGDRPSLFGFFPALALTLLPLGMFLWKAPQFYLRSLVYIGKTLPWTTQVGIAYSNTWLLFWGTPPPYYTFQPVWGGFLNPILSSLFLVGLLEAIRNGRIPLYQWLCGAGILWMLPGMMARDWESFRIAPVLGVLIPLAAIGLARLIHGLSTVRSALVLVLFLLPSAGLDFHHLRVYHHLWDSPKFWQGCAKSIERYRAFQILEPKFRSEGPGLVFSDFTPGDFDQSLTVLDYDSNPVVNSALPMEKAKWAALLTNVSYKPFLDRQWGPAKTYFLSKGLLIPDGGQMLWVVPITDSNRSLFRDWYSAGQAMSGVVDHYLQDISYQSGDLHRTVLPSLERIQPLFQKDPFLETCFWELMADNLFKAGETSRAVQALDQAVRSGYPAAHLYYRQGVLWLSLQSPLKARESFLQGTRAPLDFTQSSMLLSAPARTTQP